MRVCDVCGVGRKTTPYTLPYRIDYVPCSCGKIIETSLRLREYKDKELDICDECHKKIADAIYELLDK